MISIVFAVLFLVALFLLKTTPVFKNKTNLELNKNGGLIYGSAIVGDLVNKSTSGDGIPDWEKVLWGT